MSVFSILGGSMLDADGACMAYPTFGGFLLISELDLFTVRASGAVWASTDHTFVTSSLELFKLFQAARALQGLMVTHW